MSAAATMAMSLMRSLRPRRPQAATSKSGTTRRRKWPSTRKFPMTSFIGERQPLTVFPHYSSTTVRKSASGHLTEQSDDAHNGSRQSAPDTSESGGGVRRRVHAYISHLAGY